MTLAAQLAERLSGRVVVLGIGNPLRGDDGAGVRVAELLAEAAGALVINAGESPEDHLGRVVSARPDVVLLIDAVDLGATPGSLTLFTRPGLHDHKPATRGVSLVALADFLGKATGADVLLLAIQPGRIAFGGGLSAEVDSSATALATLLGAMLAGVRERREAALAGSGV